ncbi:hypothetical protein L6R50_27820 [Myxococcota bacterium]|nr:hypothetical protein [Myxococcota bacterium]
MKPWLRPRFAAAEAVLAASDGRFVAVAGGPSEGRRGEPALPDHLERLAEVMPWLRSRFATATALLSSITGGTTGLAPRSVARSRRRVTLSPEAERLAQVKPWLRPFLEERAAQAKGSAGAGTADPRTPIARLRPFPGLTRLLEEQHRAWREFTPETFLSWTREGIQSIPIVSAAKPVSPKKPSAPQASADPSAPSKDPIAGKTPAKDPGPATGASFTLPDPWNEPRTGVCHWEFSVMANGLAGETLLGILRQEHGTAAELLRDAQRLGIGWLRQLDQADAHLSTMWKGCWQYSGIDATDNRWRLLSDDFDVPDPPGWPCAPATGPSPASWSLAPADCVDPPPYECPASPGGATSCTAPTESPKMMADALMELAGDLPARGVAGALPVLLGRGPEFEPGTDPCPSPRYYGWEYVDESGIRRSGPTAAHFELRPVDDFLAETGGLNEDVLLDEFMRQLIGNHSAEWGSTTPLPYVQLGNEMVGIVCPSALGWLILRLSELADRCQPGLGRVFPALASPSNRLDPTDEEAYLADVGDGLWRVFYHVVRAALVVRQESGIAADATRFETVMPGIERAWTADALTSLWGQVNEDLGTSYSDTTPPTTVFPLDENTVSEALLTSMKKWCLANLQAPFHIMDFHWYNSRGQEGGFLYLSALPALIERMQDTMGFWWVGGEDIPIWCTETGISSDRNPTHIAARRAAGYDASGDFHTCYSHVPSCTNHGFLGGGPEPDDAMGAGLEAFEYRIDPTVIQAIADAGDPADAIPDLPAHWPQWVFTSEFEQAVQVWSRLAMLAGAGVQKAWLYSNVVSETNQAGLPTQFYSYGLTEDFMVSVLDPVDCGVDLDGDGFSDFCKAESEFASTEYKRRSKKRAFCALKRWNQYLGSYLCAKVLRRFDGLDAGHVYAKKGFYAVVFRVADDSADRPFALVTWTDAQVFSTCADPAAPAPLGSCVPARPLIFVPDDPFGVKPLAVQTIPHEAVIDPSVYDPDGTGAGGWPEIADPCLADAESPAEPAAGDPGYAGAKVWRFGPDQELPYSLGPRGVLGVRLGVHPHHPPVLTLLPPGELLLYDQSAAAVESLATLDAAALQPSECDV